MKKTFFIVLLLVLIVAIWLWPHRNRPTEQPVAETSISETNQSNASRVAIRNGQTNTTNVSEPTPESDPAAWIEKRRKQIEEERQKGLNEWRTPIEFYGMVVDENSNAVSGVQIDFSCNDISTTGTSHYQTTSDTNGLFSLHNVQGKLLVVRLSKQGYYVSKRDNDSFQYGDRYNHFVPDSTSPVVFHVQKKGATEPLIHVQAPMGGAKSFKIAKDGTPVDISLVSGTIVPSEQGDLKVQCWTDNQGKPSGDKYAWKCQVSVSNGGLLQSTNEFDLQAPLDGYKSSDVIEMPTTLEDDWSNHTSRRYFLKLANGNYARITFEMVAGGDHFFQIESFLNPSGSRNLEYDPKIAIQSGRQ
jgi:hypothetical protein